MESRFLLHSESFSTAMRSTINIHVAHMMNFFVAPLSDHNLSFSVAGWMAAMSFHFPWASLAHAKHYTCLNSGCCHGDITTWLKAQLCLNRVSQNHLHDCRLALAACWMAFKLLFSCFCFSWWSTNRLSLSAECVSLHCPRKYSENNRKDRIPSLALFVWRRLVFWSSCNEPRIKMKLRQDGHRDKERKQRRDGKKKSS